MDSEEIDQYAEYIDLLLTQIQNTAPELPTNFPFIEIKIADDADFKELDSINLHDRYFNYSQKFVSSDYLWGGFDNNKSEKYPLQRFNERDDERKESNQIISEILKEQQEKDNCFFINKIPRDILSEVIKQNPDLIKKWLEPIQNQSPSKIIRICIVFYEVLCSVLLEQSHPRAIELYQYLSNIESKVILIHSKTNIRYLEYYLFKASPNNSVKQRWLENLENCHSDLELMELIIAAQQGKGTSWLKSYVEENLKSPFSLNFSRAVTILGFLEANSTFEKLTKLTNNQPDTWRKKLVDTSIQRWQRNSWAKYWFKEFFNQSDSVLAWRSFRLFLRCVDWRFWSWKEQLTKEFSLNSFFQSRLTFLEDNIDTIKNSIKKNQNNKEIKESFLDCKILYRQAWPFYDFNSEKS